MEATNTTVFGKSKDVLYDRFKAASNVDISLQQEAKNLIKFEKMLKNPEDKDAFKTLFAEYYNVYKKINQFMAVKDM
jgi:hypothetical protein